MITVHTKIPDKAKHKLIMESLRYYLPRMGMQNWYIWIKYENVDDTYCMETESQAAYYKAILSIDIKQLDDKFIPEYIRHELFHALSGMYTDAALALCKEDKGLTEILSELEERLATDFEQMPIWDRLRKLEKKKGRSTSR